VAGSCVPVRRVFITSEAFAPNFGSAASADQVCQTVADGKGLGGTFRAWISDDKSWPAQDFTRSSDPYVLLDDTLVANDWTDLTDGSLAHSIDRDEAGQFISVREAWTGTDEWGGATADNCNRWKSAAAAHLANQGVSDLTNAGWTNVYLQYCDRLCSLYCFEQ
jgi:hypothetical protein